MVCLVRQVPCPGSRWWPPPLQAGAAQAMAWYGEPAALVVGESERPVVELGPQRAVLLKERGEGLSLALVEPGA